MSDLQTALAEALADIEESRLDPRCLTDQCDHEDGECPEPFIGCGDAAAILATQPMQDWLAAHDAEVARKERERLAAEFRITGADIKAALRQLGPPGHEG